jgi:hypothetical protein
MTISRGELKGQILRLLHKTAANPGMYTNPTIDDAIQEAMDFVSVEMFLADEGWQKKVWALDTEAGQTSIDLPADICMIEDVRYLIGDLYVPMRYYVPHGEPKFTDSTSARQDGCAYEIIDNALYFNPSLSEGNTAGIQIVGQAFPQKLVDDLDTIEQQFNPAFLHFIKYNAASILAATIEKASRPWAAQETLWYDKMKAIIVQRNKQTQPLREFEG